jgi:hypothetical protein
MTPALAKLIEIGSKPFGSGVAPFGDAVDRWGDIGASVQEVLSRKNGFFCFESALRFFPSTTVESSWGISEWNSPELWKADYRGLADEAFCFAEDIFERQFVIHERKVSVFEPETGDLEFLANSLEEWAARLLLDYNQMTGHAVAHNWQSVHGPLPPRHRLMAKTPFVLGGNSSPQNLVAMDSVRIMKNLGNLAHQLHDLPDGMQVKFKIVP